MAEIAEDARKAITEELLAEATHVLDSLTLAELESPRAQEKFGENMLERARMKAHLHSFEQRRGRR